MTMMTHAYSHRLLQRQSSSATGVSNATSYLAILKRFAKFTLSMGLVAVLLSAVMAIRCMAWFPPILHH